MRISDWSSDVCSSDLGSVYDRAETDDVADPGLRWRGGALLSHGAGQPDKREGDGGAVAASSGSASHTHGNLGCVRAAAVESLPAVAGGSQGASRTDDSIGRREFPLRRQHTHA